MNNTKIIALAIIFGTLAGAISSYTVDLFEKPATEELIKEFYETENAVHVSPHSLRTKMDKGDTNFILVDLRSREEYEKEHIIGAINIPAYSDKYTSNYTNPEILAKFKALPKGKEIIVYCYSIPCMTGRKIGKILAENEIYVKILGIGWNEWRYDWNSWNHEHEWNITNVSNYVWSGSDPGTPKLNLNSTACLIGGNLSC